MQEIRLAHNAPRLGHRRTACRERRRRAPEPRRLAGARSLPSRPRPEAPRTLAPGTRQPRRKRHPSTPKGRSHPAPSLLRASDRSGALLAARPQARDLRAKNQNSEAQNVVKQTTSSTHPSTPSEFKQMRSGLLHATKPGRRKFKNHLLCQSRFYVSACRIYVLPASLIYTDVERPCSTE